MLQNLPEEGLGKEVEKLQAIAKNYLESVIGLVIIIIIITKDVCHNLWSAQTALIHYTREPADD